MTDGGLLARWRSAVAVTVVVAVLGAVGWAAAGPGSAGAQSDLDVDEARTKLAEYIAENPPLPPGSATPPEGPPCPLATPEQVVDAVEGVPVSVAPWYAYTAFDSQLQSDVGDRVAVVRCVAAPPAAGDVGVGLFALDIGPYDEVGLDFDRVARRFGVGRPTWVELPDIGGDFVGLCSTVDLARQSCVLLWHLDGLVIGVEFLGGDDLDVIFQDAGDITADIVRDVFGTLIDGLPATTTTSTTTTTSSTTTTSTTSTTTTTTEPPTTTSSTTSTTTEPPTTTSSTTTTTTEPPTTTSSTTTTTTEPPTTTSSTTTTTTEPPTTTSSTTTTTTEPPTTTSSTTTSSTTTTTTEPPTTSSTTTTAPPTTTTTTTTTTSTTTTTVPLMPLWEFIGDDADLTEFAEAVEDAGLVDLFDGSTPAADVLAEVLPDPLPQPVIDVLGAEGITVLAPTNAAIEALPTWDDIVADDVALQQFVLAHVLPGQLDEQEIFAATQVTALSGDVLLIDPATQTINGAHLVVVDQLGTNGVAHTVDAVLVVPSVTLPTTEVTTTAAPTLVPAPPTEPAPAPPPPPPTPPPATGA